MRPAITGQGRLGIVHQATGGAHTRYQFIQVIGQQRGVSLLERMEIRFDPEMQLNAALLEPKTATPANSAGLGASTKPKTST